jgi:hypothetical protein
MPDIVPLRVQLVAKTEFVAPEGVPWSTDADGGQALAEFAGRACYQSWKKPNPATATNAGYLRHILEVGHLSVLEHGTVSFYITGVSRSLTHEQGVRGAAGGPGEAVRRRPQRHAAPQAGPAGGARRAAQRHGDPDRRHRQLPRLAPFHRDARHRARRRRDP